jgi:hypothetical protein
MNTGQKIYCVVLQLAAIVIMTMAYLDKKTDTFLLAGILYLLGEIRASVGVKL